MNNTLKKYILKPIYEILFAISPDLADFIENIIYKLRIKRKFKTLFLKQHLCVDISVVSRQDSKTGIQRVVNRIFNEIKNSKKDVLGTQLYNGNIVIGNNLQGKYDNLIALELDKNSHILFLDSAWNYYRDAQKILEKMELKKIKTSVVIYDMFPLIHPEWFPSSHFKRVYYKWCSIFFRKVDNIICISRKVADDVIEYYKKENICRNKELKIFCIPMGADVLETVELRNPVIRDEIKNIFLVPTFIMVGTVEPRKGHNIVLEALNKLLEAGIEVQILIIGKDGWSNQSFKKKLWKNIYYNEKIFWYQDVSDVELSYCYKNAKAIILASLDEGYGLPIIEAAHYKLPIICSDIPIFKEVTQGKAIYFNVNNPQALADTIAFCLKTNLYLDSSKIKMHTWKEASDVVISIIENNAQPYKIIR